jgi:transcriptional regulator with XRE-family HTH domain
MLAFNGDALRKYRTQRGLSLSKLSALTQTTKASLIGYEHGRIEPTISTVGKIADCLNIDPNELLTRNGRQKTCRI